MTTEPVKDIAIHGRKGSLIADDDVALAIIIIMVLVWFHATGVLALILPGG